MRSLKGNPKVIQFLQMNKPSLLPPHIQIPNSAAEDPPSAFLTVEGPPTIHEADPSMPASSVINRGSPDADTSNPLAETILPKDVSADAPLVSIKKKKPKLPANPLMRPSTRAQTRQQETGHSDTPAVCATHIDSPLTEEPSDADPYEKDDTPDVQAYEVEEILNFKYDEHVRIVSTLWLFHFINALA
jgi:hypothetical protein